MLVKICLLGDGAVGKTALRERYLGKGFQAGYVMTIGADFAVRETQVDGKVVKFQIWDLAGQPRFGSVRELYYRGSMGALLVYDLTRRESFENLRSWLDELWTNNGRGKVPIIVIGNKADLRADYEDSVQENEGHKYAEKLGEEIGVPSLYVETSAKTGQNVEEAFATLARSILQFVGN